MIIAIDGPAASGKGTLAKRLAAHYRLPHLDTGLLYRAVARALLDDGRALTEVEAATIVARELDLKRFEDERCADGRWATPPRSSPPSSRCATRSSICSGVLRRSLAA